MHSNERGSVSTYPRRPKAEALDNAVDVFELLLDPFNWYESFGLHCFGLITIGGRWMSLQLGVLDVECLCLTESTIVLGKMR